MPRDLAQAVDHFIQQEIESVPHLEALLLLFRHRDRGCSVAELAAQLYLPPAKTQAIADSLIRRRLLRREGEEYRYDSTGAASEDLMVAVESTYRRELIRISRMIHAKPPAAMRDFARAFRLTKERE